MAAQLKTLVACPRFLTCFLPTDPATVTIYVNLYTSATDVPQKFDWQNGAQLARVLSAQSGHVFVFINGVPTSGN